MIEVSVKNRADSVLLNISDNGVGLPQDRLRLFETAPENERGYRGRPAPPPAPYTGTGYCRHS